MIISHKYRFIFIKTGKTAGTSIEIALSKHCGPDDVITPISPEDEEIRKRLGYRGPQNYLLPIWRYGPRDCASVLLRRRRKMEFYNHISAREIRLRIGRQIWNDYFKFCFERNPWDRAVSLYYWRNQSNSHPSISNFIASKALLSLKSTGHKLYTIDEQIAVDRICRFENLPEDLETIRKELGIPEKLDLPRAKSRFRKDKRGYREIFGEKEKDRIAELFQEEIKLLDYQF